MGEITPKNEGNVGSHGNGTWMSQEVSKRLVEVITPIYPIYNHSL